MFGRGVINEPNATGTKSTDHRHTKSPLHFFPIPDERFQHINIDIVGPLPIDNGYSYILKIIDGPSAKFESELWHQLMVFLGSKIIRTTPYHPCANGMVERFHCYMKQALIFSSPNKRWVNQLPLVLLNSQEDLHCTTAEMVYRTTLALPADFLKASNYELGTFSKQLLERMTGTQQQDT
nr:uncharacterized protein LOC113807320 [Penaeus vannamei]